VSAFLQLPSLLKIRLYFLWNSGRVLLQKGEDSLLLRLQNDGREEEEEEEVEGV